MKRFILLHLQKVCRIFYASVFVVFTRFKKKQNNLPVLFRFRLKNKQRIKSNFVCGKIFIFFYYFLLSNEAKLKMNF